MTVVSLCVCFTPLSMNGRNKEWHLIVSSDHRSSISSSRHCVYDTDRRRTFTILPAACRYDIFIKCVIFLVYFVVVVAAAYSRDFTYRLDCTKV